MQVTRQRRSSEKVRRLSRRTTLVTAGIAVALGVTGTAVASTYQFGTQQVAQSTAKGEVISSDQYLKPYGSRTVINDGKIMSSTVSPDGTHLAAAVTDGDAALVIMDLATGQVKQKIGANAADDLRISSAAIGQEGPTYSPDGKQLWLGQANGYTRFTVNADGTLSTPTAVDIPAVGTQQALVGAAVFSADGSTVYSAVNGQNRVVALDATTGTVEQSWAVGNAPRGLALVGGKLYVSNEGGRPARAGETTMNSYGTQVPADPDTGASTTGTVSVIDTGADKVVRTIDVGLHPTAVYARKGAVFVTNTADNNVSVIDTRKDKVVQTIATQPWPEAKVGYEPDAVTLTDDGHLLVTLGRANAVAVFRYKSAQEPASYVGLLPTDYFPAEITTVGKKVVVSNTRGIDARRPTTASGHGTHDTTSSLTQFTLPSDLVIRSRTAKVFQQNGWTPGSVTTVKGESHAKPVPVPARLGDPSTIKHVFLLVKENRTYDQVYGDLPQGDGDPALTTFGANVTPNQHALAQQFGLYDNFYDIGTNSAEGHNWLMQSDNPEYTESSAGEYTRSYDTENDVLGHQKSGFIWTGAQAAGKSVKDFGEFQSTESKPSGATWQNLYCDSKNMAATGAQTQYPIQTGSAIPSLNKVSVQGFPMFDLDVPDIYKEQIWQQDFEKNGPANLNMFWFSNDHTGGPANASAEVADNDLAVGRMVDEISHSSYWKDSAIFVVEDDSQNGLDHVDGHRAPVQIISPYAQHGTVDSHYYSQITMIRTVEQILGIHPMNQKDSAATPMFGAFTGKADTTPFTAVPNRTSLTLGVSPTPSCGADTPAAQDADAAPAPTSAAVPQAEQGLAAQWKTWASHQRLTGSHAVPDYANAEQMNRYTWYQTHAWTKPYPGDSKVYAPNDVPGAYLPSAESDG
ncbi:bifunctional YncE family protein/alkaline phosphatase family protein [Streptomyces doebereineriae]|uniref:Bifunctional YncE family protein/alkaline phosphatase family protein n=1 Tax=Streptomyces doebereineriae TaxID=3075528 RepID=A0ABU2VRA4_9ACTN|nr:bifunctional YncE family protein/alkaline phosphatase family protein [Streptomyces sp. DSM 41640]MDT0487859.1 bifunctional YncE family protein/alkaline phosphatase family protein [Streptomyces sp. DSM 41640]